MRNTSTLLSRLSLPLARLAHLVPTNFASATPTLSLAGINRWSKTIQLKQRRLLIPVVRLPLGQAYEHQLRCHPAPSSSPVFLKSFDGDIKPITYDAPDTKLRCVLASASLRRSVASYAFKCGVPVELISLQGDWSSYAVLLLIIHMKKI